MDGLHFIYFADPMCSWCWGFSPVVEALRQRTAEVLPIRLVMGGLRPGTTTAMPEDARRNLVAHWKEIHELTGQPFGEGLIGLDGFVYDTDPAARAVVLARRTSTDLALDYLARVQAAFYAEGRDVTKNDVLVDLAGELGLEREAFAAGLTEEALKSETWRDYAMSQRAGVTGFPTLIVGPNADGTFAPVSRGYQDPQSVLASVGAWLTAVRSAAE
jgi:putative protein-disulfide isomerase